MQKINNEHFGQFLSQLRKEKELTQNNLQKNYIFQIKQLASGKED